MKTHQPADSAALQKLRAHLRANHQAQTLAAVLPSGQRVRLYRDGTLAFV